MVELPFVGTPKQGDLLAFSYGSCFEFGIFAGYGRGTVQFYRVTSYNADKLTKGNPPHKSYMGGGYLGNRVLRYDPNMLPPNERSAFDKIIEFLKLR